MKRSPMKRHPRPEAETLRIYGTPERREWVTRQPCAVCGVTPSVNAHAGPKGSKGTGYKAACCWIVPLCQTHHDEYDGRSSPSSKKAFEAAYNIDLAHAASLTDARWEQYYAITHPEPKG